MFDVGKMQKELRGLPDRFEKIIVAFGDTTAEEMRSMAVKERKWIDRTAHARQRLKGYCIRTDKGIRIYLAHGVEYGVYLEFGNEKKYAVIYPILRREGPKIMAALGKAMR